MYSPLSALLIFYSGRHFTFKLYRLYGLFSIKFLSTQHFNLSLFLSYLHSISSLFYFSNYYIYISVQPLLSLSLSLSFTTHLRINLMRAEQNREYKGMKSKKMKIKQHHHLSWLTTTYPNHADLFKYFLPHLPFKWIERMRERERERERQRRKWSYSLTRALSSPVRPEKNCQMSIKVA